MKSQSKYELKRSGGLRFERQSANGFKHNIMKQIQRHKGMLLPTQKANKFAAISFAVSLVWCLRYARKEPRRAESRPSHRGGEKWFSSSPALRRISLELIYVEKAASEEAG